MAGIGDILAGLGGIAGGAQTYQLREQQLRDAQLKQQLAALQMANMQQQQQANSGLFQAIKGGALNQPQGQGFAPLPLPPQPIPNMPNFSGQTAAPGGQGVRGSWFGNYGNWRDPSDSGLQAGGQPVSAGPGIALPDRSTLGQQFDVTAPSGQTMTLPQTDIGPAKWTGRGVDINAPAAQAFGYSPQNFPTDQRFIVKAHQEMNAALSPQDQNAGTSGAQMMVRQFPQIPQIVRTADPQQVAQIIDRTNPGASDEVKGAIFLKLLPIMNTQAQQQTAEMWRVYGAQEHQQEFGIRQQELGEQRQFNRELATQRLEQGQERIAQSQQKIDTATQKTAGLPDYQFPDKWEGMPDKPPPGSGITAPIWSAALTYAQTNKMPALGFQSGPRAQILAAAPAAQHALGIKPSEAAVTAAEYHGLTAGESTLGRRLANLTTSIEEAQKAAPAVVDTSKGVPRTEFPAFNEFNQWLQLQTGDPNIVRFRGALNTYLNIYSKGINPTGQLTDQQQRHAYETLRTNFSQGQIEAGIDQLSKELGYAKEGLSQASGELRSLFRPGGGGMGGSGQQQPAATGSMPVPDAFKGDPDGTTYDREGAVWVKRGNQMVKQ